MANKQKLNPDATKSRSSRVLESQQAVLTKSRIRPKKDPVKRTQAQQRVQKDVPQTSKNMTQNTVISNLETSKICVNNSPIQESQQAVLTKSRGRPRKVTIKETPVKEQAQKDRTRQVISNPESSKIPARSSRVHESQQAQKPAKTRGRPKKDTTKETSVKERAQKDKTRHVVSNSESSKISNTSSHVNESQQAALTKPRGRPRKVTIKETPVKQRVQKDRTCQAKTPTRFLQNGAAEASVRQSERRVCVRKLPGEVKKKIDETLTLQAQRKLKEANKKTKRKLSTEKQTKSDPKRARRGRTKEREKAESAKRRVQQTSDKVKEKKKAQTKKKEPKKILKRKTVKKRTVICKLSRKTTVTKTKAPVPRVRKPKKNSNQVEIQPQQHETMPQDQESIAESHEENEQISQMNEDETERTQFQEHSTPVENMEILQELNNTEEVNGCQTVDELIQEPVAPHPLNDCQKNVYNSSEEAVDVSVPTESTDFSRIDKNLTNDLLLKDSAYNNSFSSTEIDTSTLQNDEVSQLDESVQVNILSSENSEKKALDICPSEENVTSYNLDSTQYYIKNLSHRSDIICFQFSETLQSSSTSQNDTQNEELDIEELENLDLGKVWAAKYIKKSSKNPKYFYPRSRHVRSLGFSLPQLNKNKGEINNAHKLEAKNADSLQNSVSTLIESGYKEPSRRCFANSPGSDAFVNKDNNHLVSTNDERLTIMNCSNMNYSKIKTEGKEVVSEKISTEMDFEFTQLSFEQIPVEDKKSTLMEEKVDGEFSIKTKYNPLVCNQDEPVKNYTNISEDQKPVKEKELFPRIVSTGLNLESPHVLLERKLLGNEQSMLIEENVCDEYSIECLSNYQEPSTKDFITSFNSDGVFDTNDNHLVCNEDERSKLMQNCSNISCNQSAAEEKEVIPQMLPTKMNLESGQSSFEHMSTDDDDHSALIDKNVHKGHSNVFHENYDKDPREYLKNYQKPSTKHFLRSLNFDAVFDANDNHLVCNEDERSKLMQNCSNVSCNQSAAEEKEVIPQKLSTKMDLESAQSSFEQMPVDDDDDDDQSALMDKNVHKGHSNVCHENYDKDPSEYLKNYQKSSTKYFLSSLNSDAVFDANDNHLVCNEDEGLKVIKTASKLSCNQSAAEEKEVVPQMLPTEIDIESARASFERMPVDDDQSALIEESVYEETSNVCFGNYSKHSNEHLKNYQKHSSNYFMNSSDSGALFDTYNTDLINNNDARLNNCSNISCNTNALEVKEVVPRVFPTERNLRSSQVLVEQIPGNHKQSTLKENACKAHSNEYIRNYYAPSSKGFVSSPVSDTSVNTNPNYFVYNEDDILKPMNVFGIYRNQNSQEVENAVSRMTSLDMDSEPQLVLEATPVNHEQSNSHTMSSASNSIFLHDESHIKQNVTAPQNENVESHGKHEPSLSRRVTVKAKTSNVSGQITKQGEKTVKAAGGISRLIEDEGGNFFLPSREHGQYYDNNNSLLLGINKPHNVNEQNAANVHSQSYSSSFIESHSQVSRPVINMPDNMTDSFGSSHYATDNKQKLFPTLPQNEINSDHKYNKFTYPETKMVNDVRETSNTKNSTIPSTKQPESVTKLFSKTTACNRNENSLEFSTVTKEQKTVHDSNNGMISTRSKPAIADVCQKCHLQYCCCSLQIRRGLRNIGEVGKWETQNGYHQTGNVAVSTGSLELLDPEEDVQKDQSIFSKLKDRIVERFFQVHE